MSMKMREAQRKDCEGICLVEQESFSQPWTKDAVINELMNKDLTLYYVLEDEQGVIWGYAGLWHVLDEGQITNIALRKACRGRGYGELLLRLLMETAWERGCSVIFLEVRFSNLPALRLYRKLGYTVVSVRRQYYTQPMEDAYVMSCERKKYRWADR
ncbi:ribosomal-protein-alanine N-acetyltransferase [Megasphaera paucivorans]|uniref:Ribosomal-protein-alanine N-acetyltransferase n=1 Tax=Megasphaera paucivorans TaxID=349095 RepID=A0A1G9ZGU1_9FIRM|nr:ribosomal-protein-alanine N-acetyltransferase [Megasphaera paucivorans]